MAQRVFYCTGNVAMYVRTDLEKYTSDEDATKAEGTLYNYIADFKKNRDETAKL